MPQQPSMFNVNNERQKELGAYYTDESGGRLPCNVGRAEAD